MTTTGCPAASSSPRLTVVGICAAVVGGVALNSDGSIRTTGEPVAISILKKTGSSAIMFIDALTKIRLPAMRAVVGSPRVPIVVIPGPVGPPEPPPPQERVVVATSPHTTKLIFIDKIFCLTPTERNR